MKNALCKKDIQTLSNSTLAWMLRDLGFKGDTITCTMTEKMQVHLLEYYDKTGKIFDTWQDCYNSYKEYVGHYTKMWLLDYGMDESQANTLIVLGKIDTSHGIYTLNSNIVTLKRHTDKSKRQFNLLDGFAL